MYKNSILQIEKKKGMYSLKVKNYKENMFFIKTFAEPILACKSALETEEISIELIVTNIISLEDLIKEKKMTSELLELLFTSLAQQLELLEQTQHTVLNFSTKHIFLFKSIAPIDTFIFLNIDDICELSENTLMINKPFIMKKHMAPELKKVKKIPNRTITKTAAYWSLASLIQNINQPHPKLEWALKRCLVNDPEHRFLLLI
jgi:hypothetical protein